MTSRALGDAKFDRSNCKRKITNLTKEADLLLNRTIPLSGQEYENLVSKLRSELDRLSELNDEVLKFKLKGRVIPDGETPDACEQAEDSITSIEEQYYDSVNITTVPVVHELLRVQQKVNLSNASCNNTPGSSQTTRDDDGCPSIKTKLPVFDSDYRQYKRWKEEWTYRSKRLDKKEQLYQLAESLASDRDKRRVRASLDIVQAWEHLDGIYGDEDFLMEVLMEDIEKLSPYTTRGKVVIDKLEDFVDQLSTFVIEMEAHGKGNDLNGRVLMRQILRKLPEEHRLKFLEDIDNSRCADSIQGLVKWTGKTLILLKKAKVTEAPSPQTPSTTIVRSHAVAVEERPRNTNAFNTSMLPSKSKCHLHPQSRTHFLRQCNAFKNLPLPEKHKLIKELSICCICGHDNCPAGTSPVSRCQFAQKCESCSQSTHFSAICPTIFGESSQNDTTQSPNAMQRPVSTTSIQPVAQVQSSHVSISGTDDHSTPAQTSPVGSYSVNGKHTNTGRQIIAALPTLMCDLVVKGFRFRVRVLLDSGSQVSLVRKGIIPMSASTEFQDFEVTPVGGDSFSDRFRMIDGYIESRDGSSFKRPVRMAEIEQPCGKVPFVTHMQLANYPHLKDLDIEVAPSSVIDVMLGVENNDIFAATESRLGNNQRDPIATKTKLGWTVQGGDSNLTTDLSCNNLRAVNSNGLSLSPISACKSDLHEFLGIESAGLQPRVCKCEESSRNELATNLMRDSITRCGDTLQVNLVWAKSPDGLPNNHEYAMKRQQNLEKQLTKRPQDWNAYCVQIQDLLSRGVARLVPMEEIDNDMQNEKPMWFLPHFAVAKESTTTPLRLVFDGKARYKGHCLNDYLVKGENVNSDLFSVSLRFREREIGLTADISKMYQAVRLSPKDARFHRFLFRESIDQPMQCYELQTVTFGDKASPTAAIIALRYVVSEFAPKDTELESVVRNQFYVDDLCESSRSTIVAGHLKTKLIDTLKKGNFKIRKWSSNVRELCDEEFYPQTGVTTVLGTRWDLEKDTLSVKSVPYTGFTQTRRNNLRKIASYYDVFGILAAVLVKPKMALQHLWRFPELDWDTPIPAGCSPYRDFVTSFADLENVENIEIPRCLIPKRFYGMDPLPSVTMHGFSDASENALGMGVWLRWDDGESEPEVVFVCAKTKVTPLVQISIPRKELNALLLLSRLVLTVKDALRFTVEDIMLWIDNTTVLSWLTRQSKDLRSYVACRTGELALEFDVNRQIRYVPTELNIADLLSRGIKVCEVPRLIDGPSFLCLSEDGFPKLLHSPAVDKGDPELKKNSVNNAMAFAAGVEPVTQMILNPADYSSLERLIRVTARVMSVLSLPRGVLLQKDQLLPQMAKFPSRQERRHAELYWIQIAQRSLDLSDPQILKLSPIYDEKEKVYRVGGRLGNTSLSYDTKHPYLLPKNHVFSQLIVNQAHRLSLHSGHLTVAAMIRRRFWIVGDIKLCKGLGSKCQICRRYRGNSLQQKMGNLPGCRVVPFSPPFKTTFVDYLGPVLVKINRNTTRKGYGALFVCAVTRAVHLTCVQDLTTPAFLQALDRFVSIRGAPALMKSDNGTCFRGADNELQALRLKLDTELLRRHSLVYDIDWEFGPPAGPYYQGLVERQVQEVKKAAKYLKDSEKLTFIEWETIFCKISALLNSRPLTASSSSPLDEPPITPNHFLIGRGSLASPEILCEDYIGDTRKRRELCTSLVHSFWKRWMVIIPKLSVRNIWNGERENIKLLDVVLIMDEDVPRGSWKMAEVVKLYPGNDGLVRVVDLRLAGGNILKRPITKLVMLMQRGERTDVE